MTWIWLNDTCANVVYVYSNATVVCIVLHVSGFKIVQSNRISNG
jgi:hypothetical protein